jgi:hypothetical protein
MDRNLCQIAQARRDSHPQPLGELFRCGVTKQVDVVQVSVVKFVDDRLRNLFDVAEVNYPTYGLSNYSWDTHRNPKRVAVQPCALVIRRDVRQAMRGLEAELLERLHHW